MSTTRLPVKKADGNNEASEKNTATTVKLNAEKTESKKPRSQTEIIANWRFNPLNQQKVPTQVEQAQKAQQAQKEFEETLKNNGKKFYESLQGMMGPSTLDTILFKPSSKRKYKRKNQADDSVANKQMKK